MRAVLIALLLLALAAVPAAAQTATPTPTPTPAPTPTPTPPPAPTITGGIHAGGVDLSGLTVDQARRAVNHAMRPRLRRPIVVATAGRRFRLRPHAVHAALDAQRTAVRALRTGRRTPPATGEVRNVGLWVRYSHRALNTWVAGVAGRVAIAPRDAWARIALRRIHRHGGHRGRALRVEAVTRKVKRALVQLRRSRIVHTERRYVRPAITRRGLRRVYPTVITVDRRHFVLRLFKRLRLVRRYPVAVGQPAYPTPTGLFHISDKQVNPTWTAPNSPWAGELAGQSFDSSDPTNPLKARWMGIVNGVGIHGTGEDASIGHAESHGCIRMHVWDVVDLYPRVPLGTPVYIR